MEALQSPEGRLKFDSSEKYTAIGFSPRFSVQSQIAEGGTSALYLAKDTLLNSSLVVLKNINSSLLRSAATQDIASREVAIAKQLSHPNLIKIYDIRRSKKVDYIVMEYLPGSSLKDLLSRRSRLDYASAMTVLRQLVSVLNYLHRQGVVHSDVKPSNIIVTNAGDVKLIDLANCRRDANNPAPEVQITGNHFFGYSLDYSSPQVISDKPATTSDDVFSLSCVLYELMAGKSPIPSEKQSTDMSLSSVAKPKSINYLQWAVLKRGMSADHRKRYSSVAQFYRRFTLAKYVTPIALSSVLFFALAAFAVMNIGPPTDHLNNDLSIQNAAYEQQLSVEKTISVILSEKPMERYRSLGQLEVFPPLLREGALSELYKDVVMPIVGYVESAILVQKGIPDFDVLHSYLDEILVFYPRSKDLASLKNTLFEEQRMLVDGLSVQLSEIISGDRYTAIQGGEVNRLVGQLADLGVSVKGGFLQAGYGESYAGYVSKALTANNWAAIADAHDFASVVGRYLPEFNVTWKSVDNNLLRSSREFSNYVNSGDQSTVAFPEDAVAYLSQKEWKSLQNAIKRSWYNKDISVRVDELLALKVQYKMPVDSPLYQKMVKVLNNKINQKIKFHKTKSQRVSAKNLADLSKKLI
ncbi:MAG: serine/threonine-protein kinase [Cellvibrionaceae bacterium]